MENQERRESLRADINQGDEIDLFELWESLVDEKVTIFWSFLTIVVLTTIYAFSVTPVYKATSYLLPPKQEDVLRMNDWADILSSGSSHYSPKEVFGLFKTNLQSRRSLKNLFEQYGWIKVFAPSYENLSVREKTKVENKVVAGFIKSLSVDSFNKTSVLDGFSISLELSLPKEDVVKIVNDLVVMTQENTIQQLYDQITSEKLARITQLKEKIEASRQVQLANRMDKLVHLNEAIDITQGLNIHKPISKGPSLNINNVNSEEPQNFPLYMLGSDLLIAEKKVLEDRKNDDPFIENLRVWQQRLQQLENLKIDKDKFEVVRIDAEAITSDKVKPKKALILAVGGVLGLMLGVFIALIRRAIKNRKASLAAC